MRKFSSLLITIVIILVIALAGCSANYHLKRSKHHFEKAKSKGAEIKLDTVFVFDTIRTETVLKDSIFIDVGDTVRIEKDRLKVVYKRDTITNKVYLSGECEPDTIIREVPIQVQETVYIEKSLLETIGIDKDWEKILFYVGAVLLFLLLVWRFIKP